MDTVQDVLEITRGHIRLRLCSIGIRWWVEADDLDTGDTYRHEHRAGSREGITPTWDRTLDALARGQFTPRDDALGTWWLLAHTPE